MPLTSRSCSGMLAGPSRIPDNPDPSRLNLCEARSIRHSSEESWVYELGYPRDEFHLRQFGFDRRVIKQVPQPIQDYYSFYNRTVLVEQLIQCPLNSFVICEKSLQPGKKTILIEFINNRSIQKKNYLSIRAP